MVVFYKQGICEVLLVAFGSNFRIDKDKNLFTMELQNILQYNKLASSHLATTTRSISGKE